MAVYKLNSKKSSSKDIKKIVGFTLIGIASIAYFFLTGIWKVMFNFLLGTFGVFAYVFFLLMFIVGLALVNNRRYVKGVRYALSLTFMIYFFLSILQLIILGAPSDLTFSEYLALNYSTKWTAGGIMVGALNSVLVYISNLVGAYIILSLGLLLCLGLFLDSLNVFKQTSQNIAERRVVKLQEKKREVVEEPKRVEPVKEEVKNVVLNGAIQEESEQEKRARTTRELLGLEKKTNAKEPKKIDVVEERKIDRSDPEYLKKLILTPPEIDYEQFFRELNKPKTPPKAEVKAAVEEIKQENKNIYGQSINYKQEQNWNYSNPYSFSNQNTRQEKMNFDESKPQEIKPREDEFVNRTNPFEKEEKDVVSQADMILRGAVEEELEENKTDYEEAREEFETKQETPSDRGDRVFMRDRDRGFSEMRRGGEFAPPERPTIKQEEPEIYEVDEDEELNVPYVYTKPPIDLITTQSVDLSALSDDVAEKRVMLENTLENFGTPAKVENVIIGPAVTRYELEMPQGVPVSKIKTRQEDITLSLAAEGEIRIEAPVPGKSVVGIEVPNKSIATVSLRDIIESPEFQNAKSPLTFAIGKDISGKIITADLQKLTHLLVAGTTGSGKSVCLNAIILSIIYKASPEDVKIVLVDPKRVEFTNFNELPHLIMPNVICDVDKTVNTLNWACIEMDRRFEMLSMARVKNINEYNETEDVKSGKIKKMPFIVIIVDELADLMMVSKKDVEEKIVRLAQKARAAGMHLILATQKPLATVVTGLIKGNIPSRISFATVNGMDSQVILDRVGAEKLLGKGDMLYFPIGANNPTRVQGCFVTTNEINNIIDFVKDNNECIYDKKIEKEINNPNQKEGASVINDKLDDLFPYACKTAIECGQVSNTMLRRKYAIGFSRAAKIIDQMEEAGYISSADGIKGRTVYITQEQFNEIFGDKFNN